MCRQMDRQTGRQTDRHRQADRQTDRQTDMLVNHHKTIRHLKQLRTWTTCYFRTIQVSMSPTDPVDLRCTAQHQLLTFALSLWW